MSQKPYFMPACSTPLCHPSFQQHRQGLPAPLDRWPATAEYIDYPQSVQQHAGALIAGIQEWWNDQWEQWWLDRTGASLRDHFHGLPIYLQTGSPFARDSSKLFPGSDGIIGTDITRKACAIGGSHEAVLKAISACERAAELYQEICQAIEAANGPHST